MSLFVIADLHLSFTSDKPMDIYGGWWINHTETLKRQWLSAVNELDTVLIPGDISWALKFEDAKADLAWLESLPGKKILIKGNHDLWWSSINRLKSLYSSLDFMQNSHAVYEDYAICGTRGWLCPGEIGFTTHDEKIYKREMGRLQRSLSSAKAAGYKKIIGMIHFPPTNEKLEASGFTDLFESFEVEKVVYGHLHGADGYLNGIQGHFRGVTYVLSSCDHLACKPFQLL